MGALAPAHAPVLRGIEAARQAGFRALKIDAVVVRGTNEDELADLIEFGKRAGAEVRFIEYMDVGGATQWSRSKVVSRAEILDALSRHYGRIAPVVEDSSAPAERFLLADGTVFGIIASTTKSFCRRCDRSRLTADGIWYLCLYAQNGTDLRKSLRSGATREEIKSLIVSQWAKRTDRGAEERKDLVSRGVLVRRLSPRSPFHDRHSRHPLSLYRDRHSIFQRNDAHWTLAEQLAGKQSPTQLGRALDQLVAAVSTVYKSAR
jgi:cyclic pyranopterin phosphate synthase